MVPVHLFITFIFTYPILAFFLKLTTCFFPYVRPIKEKNDSLVLYIFVCLHTPVCVFPAPLQPHTECCLCLPHIFSSDTGSKCTTSRPARKYALPFSRSIYSGCRGLKCIFIVNFFLIPIILHLPLIFSDKFFRIKFESELFTEQ